MERPHRNFVCFLKKRFHLPELIEKNGNLRLLPESSEVPSSPKNSENNSQDPDIREMYNLLFHNSQIYTQFETFLKEKEPKYLLSLEYCNEISELRDMSDIQLKISKVLNIIDTYIVKPTENGFHIPEETKKTLISFYKFILHSEAKESSVLNDNILIEQEVSDSKLPQNTQRIERFEEIHPKLLKLQGDSFTKLKTNWREFKESPYYVKNSDSSTTTNITPQTKTSDSPMTQRHLKKGVSLKRLITRRSKSPSPTPEMLPDISISSCLFNFHDAVYINYSNAEGLISFISVFYQSLNSIIPIPFQIRNSPTSSNSSSLKSSISSNNLEDFLSQFGNKTKPVMNGIDESILEDEEITSSLREDESDASSISSSMNNFTNLLKSNVDDSVSVGSSVSMGKTSVGTSGGGTIGPLITGKRSYCPVSIEELWNDAEYTQLFDLYIHTSLKKGPLARLEQTLKRLKGVTEKKLLETLTKEAIGYILDLPTVKKEDKNELKKANKSAINVIFMLEKQFTKELSLHFTKFRSSVLFHHFRKLRTFYENLIGVCMWHGDTAFLSSDPDQLLHCYRYLFFLFNTLHQYSTKSDNFYGLMMAELSTRRESASFKNATEKEELPLRQLIVGGYLWIVKWFLPRVKEKAITLLITQHKSQVAEAFNLFRILLRGVQNTDIENSFESINIESELQSSIESKMKICPIYYVGLLVKKTFLNEKIIFGVLTDSYFMELESITDQEPIKKVSLSQITGISIPRDKKSTICGFIFFTSSEKFSYETVSKQDRTQWIIALSSLVQLIDSTAFALLRHQYCGQYETEIDDVEYLENFYKHRTEQETSSEQEIPRQSLFRNE